MKSSNCTTKTHKTKESHYLTLLSNLWKTEQYKVFSNSGMQTEDGFATVLYRKAQDILKKTFQIVQLVTSHFSIQSFHSFCSNYY